MSAETAAELADAASQSWAAAARVQREAEPDHADFYALAAELVATLHALGDMAEVLRGQVAGYTRGRAVYDDSRVVAPGQRLTQAAAMLELLRADLDPALLVANGFWSEIGHIGVES